MHNIDVLVVGAGPVGLFCANELVRHGLTCRIIDKKSALSPLSKATKIHPRTHDILEDCALLDKTLEQEHPIDEILYQHLLKKGVEVEWNTELTHLSQDPNEITATIKKPKNKIELFNATWLIACDGAHSTIRHQDQVADRVFFAGDAARPLNLIREQGFNAGIQDGYNLVWKLALVERKKAKSELLNSYHQERFPALAQKHNLIRLAFRKCIKSFSSTPKDSTELPLSYTKSAIVHRLGRCKELKIGEFLPTFSLIESKSNNLLPSTAITQGTLHHLFIFSGLNSKKIPQVIELANSIAEQHEQTIKVHLVLAHKTELNAKPITLWFDEQQVHQRFQLKKPTLLLVRPDKYIGLLQKPINQKKWSEQLYLLT